MLKQCYLLGLFALFLTSCAYISAKKPPISADNLPYQSTTQFRNVSSFDRVDAQGTINVTLHTGYKSPKVVLKGDPRDLAQVHTTVSQNTLNIFVGQGYPHYGAVHVDVQGTYLNAFTYRGTGLVDGNKLYTNSLDLYLANAGITRLGGSIGLRRLEVFGKGQVEITGIKSQNLEVYLQGGPKVMLSGVANLTNLTTSGDTWFSFYWLKSDVLYIRAKDQVRIQLAGTVNRLDVELWGHAYFKGRYLRAQRSFVKTHGSAVAEISTVNHQSSLAKDGSTIYYYNLPNTREDFMAYDGSVLDMREWDRINLRDFDRYNKQFP